MKSAQPMPVPLSLVLLLLLYGSALPAQTAPATASAPVVERFTPQGTAKQVHQVQVRFSAPMVSLGDPRLPDPFSIECAASGKGRWADTRNWVYDFDEELPAGLRCRFTLSKALRTAAGVVLSGTSAFVFDTGGPAIQASFPREGWRSLDEEQVFLLRLDAPATSASIRKQAYCAIDGVGERVPVEVLTGAERTALLAQRQALGYAYYQLLWKDGQTGAARVRDRSLEIAEERIAVVRCRRRLPAAAKVQLVWGAGIAAKSGIATAQAQRLAFRVRPAFTARVECTRTEPRAGCMPIKPIVVRFSAPVPLAQALGVRLYLLGPYKDAVRLPVSPVPLDGATNDSAGTAGRVTVESVSFEAPFPESSTVTIALPPELRDDAGRAPENVARFPLEVRVDAYPPLVKFAADFGILEAGEGGVLPVTLRNVEAVQDKRAALPGKRLRVPADPAMIAGWLRRVQKANARHGEWVQDAGGQRRWQEATGARSVFVTGDRPESFVVDKPLGAQAAEVVGLPLGGPGLHVVEIASRKLGASLLGRDAPRYVSTAALVTNLAVHLKWGRESSRVWVTRLDNGMPVADAKIAITAYCTDRILWQGRTDRDGVAVVQASFGDPHGNQRCDYDWLPSPLIVTAVTADDFSFTLSGWSEGIAPHDFGLPGGGAWSINLFHTVLDRPLYRAGQTVSMKHFQRRHVSEGMATLEPAAGAWKVTIAHLGSDQRYELQARTGADGTALQTWSIPLEARLGDYAIYIEDGAKRMVQSAMFKVEEFRLPTLRADVQGPVGTQVQPREITLDLHVSYLSGGGASGLPVKLRTIVEPRAPRFDEYEDFGFGGEPVQAGVSTSSGGQWDFDPAADGDAGPGLNKAQVQPATLDAQGVARVVLEDLPVLDNAAQLTAELEYPDANGEVLTTSTRIPLAPAGVNVGIRTEGWAASAGQLRFRVVALDSEGRPLAERKVEVSLYRSTAYSYRKRLIGGFYAYETVREVTKLPAGCEGLTNAQGLLLCEVAPGVSGEVKVRAEARDAQGRLAGATRSMWVAGEDDWWFGGTEGDRMDVLPEEKEYQPGDTARLQVRMPFRTATALVTVEREGVLKSFVTRLGGRSPVIEVPIEDAYAPNVYVSVLAVRGRVSTSHLFRPPAESQAVTALVDLNKPAYRLGTAAIKVGWKPHRLQVRVTPQQQTYRIRETARVDIEVRRADGALLPAGAEIAVAAVDEALLELAPNPSWALLEAMMGERGLEVWTATAQMQVVGKRHYGRKAVLHGGGGGRERTRESFDSLLAWQGRVRLDAAGRAQVDIPLNDALSSFRIVAIAHAGAQLFGTGSATVNTSQELILVSGLPPLVREGDRFTATFTVRNTGQRTVPVEVSAQVSPALAPASASSLAPRTVKVPPGEAREVVWEVQVPVGTASLSWEVLARQTDGGARDAMRIVEEVIPAHPVRTYQATIAQLLQPLKMPVERPRAALPGRGGLEVALRAKLGEGLDGVREYMARYRYTCLEQNLSRAVALRDRRLWDRWMARLPAYMDGDGLLKYFPAEALPGEDALTAYVLSLADAAAWPVPEVHRQAMVQGLTRFVEGRIVRGSALPTADLSVRKLAAVAALARHQAARPAFLDSIAIEPDLWPTSALIDWLGILRRMPELPRAAQQRQATEERLRTRLNFQGTTMGFSTERSDALWWLMVSGDSNAVRMLLEVLDRDAWREDVPRLVRGALGRQQRGHWDTTVANAWGVLAMEQFSAVFEATLVTGATVLSYGEQDRSVSWPQASGKADFELPWDEGRETLIVEHEGGGHPWVTVRATAAMPLQEPISTGFKVLRKVTAVEQKRHGQWSRGDVMRVRLEMEAQSDMTWVVVEDPVPAGASLLGSGLATQSQLLTRDERREGWVWPAFEERRFELFRAYYRFVPRGKWVVEYTVRLNNPGRFVLPATRVEAMYAPEMLGEVANDEVVVRE